MSGFWTFMCLNTFIQSFTSLLIVILVAFSFVYLFSFSCHVCHDSVLLAKCSLGKNLNLNMNAHKGWANTVLISWLSHLLANQNRDLKYSVYRKTLEKSSSSFSSLFLLPFWLKIPVGWQTMSYKHNETVAEPATHSQSPCVFQPFHCQPLSLCSLLPPLSPIDSVSFFKMDDSINFLWSEPKCKRLRRFTRFTCAVTNKPRLSGKKISQKKSVLSQDNFSKKGGHTLQLLGRL